MMQRTPLTVRTWYTATLAVMALLPLQALASPDPMVEGARQCTQYFPVEEQRKAIPAHLLAAISSTESGRWHKGLGLALPWPWTINVEGKGYYFDTKAEAVAQVASLMKQGHRSIDVGCMQVNLMHHAGAFATIDEAFEPKTNIAYAAKFLRANYDSTGDWVKATAAYHSRTAVYGKKYLGHIEKSWNRIVAKVQQARATQGLEPAVAPKPQFSSTQLADAKPTVPGLVKVSGNAKPTTSLRPVREAQNMRIIKVSEPPQKTAEPMVIHTTDTLSAAASSSAANAPMKLADARDANRLLVHGASDTVRQVQIDSVGGTLDNGAAASRFVFAN